MSSDYNLWKIKLPNIAEKKSKKVILTNTVSMRAKPGNVGGNIEGTIKRGSIVEVLQEFTMDNGDVYGRVSFEKEGWIPLVLSKTKTYQDEK